MGDDEVMEKVLSGKRMIDKPGGDDKESSVTGMPHAYGNRPLLCNLDEEGGEQVECQREREREATRQRACID